MNDSFNIFESNIVPDSLKEIFEKAELCDVKAQFELAVAYDIGDATPVNKELAAYWYSKAAEQGHPTALGRLGHMYAGGEGVPRNYDYAIYWFQELANSGSAIGQFNMGVALEYYDSSKKDIEKAKYWYKKAATQGHEKAQDRLLFLEGRSSVQQSQQSRLVQQSRSLPRPYSNGKTQSQKTSSRQMIAAVVLWVFCFFAIIGFLLGGLSFGGFFWVLLWGVPAFILTKKAKTNKRNN